MSETLVSDVQDTRQPAELEFRRREILDVIRNQYDANYDHPDIPFPLLQELALLTQTLRRKNAGPPKEKRPAPTKKVYSLDDLL